MKIAVIGDLHLGRSVKGHDRTPDIVRAFRAAIAEAHKRGATVLVQTGDFYDGSSPSPELIALGIELVREASALFDEVVILVGNHDLRHGHDRTDALDPLRRASDLADDARPGIEGVTVATELKSLSLYDDDHATEPSAELLLLPYESRSRRVWEDLDDYDEAIRGVLTGRPIPLVVVGHLDVEGAVLSSEITARGGGHPWPKGRGWRDRVTISVDGHYHKPQEIRLSKWRIVCVGSLVRLDFGEASEAKRWIVIEV